MKRTAPTLILPLLVFAGVLLASIGMVKFTLGKAQTAELKFNAQQVQLREARTRVQKSGAEKELIIGGFKSEVQPRYDASVASSRRLRGVF